MMENAAHSEPEWLCRFPQSQSKSCPHRNSQASRPGDAQTPARADPQAAGEHRTIRLRPSYRHRCDQPRDRRLGIGACLGLPEAPAVTITDLDEPKLRMLRLALNRLSEDSRWDLEALRLEFSDMMEMSGEIDLRISGFEMGEIDVAFEASGSDEEDDLPALNETATPVTKPGDLWLLGEHRILCANALMSESYARLLGDERAQMIFTDPPWNIPIAGHVSGLGSTKHGDFAMGCGEMPAAEFEVVCAVSFSGTAVGSQWLASRKIAAAKAFTPTGLSLNTGSSTGTGALCAGRDREGDLANGPLLGEHREHLTCFEFISSRAVGPKASVP